MLQTSLVVTLSNFCVLDFVAAIVSLNVAFECNIECLHSL